MCQCAFFRLQDKGQKVLLETATGGQPRVDMAAPLSSLVFSPPAPGKRRVQQELWGGGKANDLNVTRCVKPLVGATTAKASEWAAQAAAATAAARSQSHSAALIAALGAAEVAGHTEAAFARGTRRSQVCAATSLCLIAALGAVEVAGGHRGGCHEPMKRCTCVRGCPSRDLPHLYP